MLVPSVTTEPKRIAMHLTWWSFVGGRRPLRNIDLAGDERPLLDCSGRAMSGGRPQAAISSSAQVGGRRSPVPAVH